MHGQWHNVTSCLLGGMDSSVCVYVCLRVRKLHGGAFEFASICARMCVGMFVEHVYMIVCLTTGYVTLRVYVHVYVYLCVYLRGWADPDLLISIRRRGTVVTLSFVPEQWTVLMLQWHTIILHTVSRLPHTCVHTHLLSVSLSASVSFLLFLSFFTPKYLCYLGKKFNLRHIYCLILK